MTSSDVLADQSPWILDAAWRLNLVHFSLELTLARAVPSSWHLGSAVRGVLGHALKRGACRMGLPETCHACPEVWTCSYGLLFEASQDAGSNATCPRPYVLTCTPHAAGRLVVRTVLLGRACEHAAAAFLALLEGVQAGLGAQRIPCRVERVEGVHGQEPAPCLADVLDAAGIAQSANNGGLLALATPLVLTRSGQALRHLELDVLLNAAAQRLNALALLYGGALPPAVVESVRCAERSSKAACLADRTRVVEVRRYSNRQTKSMARTGLLGEAALAGLAPEEASLLAACAWIHAGKWASMGYGQVHLHANDAPTSP